MNGAQVAFAGNWEGPANESYFDEITALGTPAQDREPDPVEEQVVAFGAVTPSERAATVQPSTLAGALAAVEAFLRRFVVFGRPEAVVAVVLWLAHTYALDYADATPYLAITSPEKGSGKTRLQECLRLLAHGRPELFIIPTAATIYRMLEADPSTPLLLDELDAVFRDRSDKYEEVRALINAGHRRGATVPRTVTTGNKHEVRFFPVFGPKALGLVSGEPEPWCPSRAEQDEAARAADEAARPKRGRPTDFMALA